MGSFKDKAAMKAALEVQAPPKADLPPLSEAVRIAGWDKNLNPIPYIEPFPTLEEDEGAVEIQKEDAPPKPKRPRKAVSPVRKK